MPDEATTGTGAAEAPPAASPPAKTEGLDAEGRSLAGLSNISEALGQVRGQPASPALAEKPAGEPKGEGGEATPPTPDEVLAKMDARLLKAAERVHISKDQLQAMLPSLGEDGLAAMLKVHADALDEHAKNLGANGRKPDDEAPPAEATGETFALPDELRVAYGEHNGDLMDGLEASIRDQVLAPVQANFKAVNQEMAGLRGMLLDMLADTAINAAGPVAKGLDKKAVLEKANVIAAGLASTGKAVDPVNCLADALAQLTQPKAAEAAREELRQKTHQRSRQVQGPPAGRTPPPPSDAQGRKMQALKEIEQGRQTHGLPPS